MRVAAITLVAAAIACEIFAYWGLNTVAGRRAFDEMAGIIPMAAGALGVPLALGAGYLWWRSRRNAARR
jgi:hypothetical protein